MTDGSAPSALEGSASAEETFPGLEPGTLLLDDPLQTVRPAMHEDGLEEELTDLPAWAPDEFRVEDTLGEGGMGVVRRARQASMGRQVAVKQLRPEHRSLAAQSKLLQEAWAAGCLEHPHIVPVYSVGRDAYGMPMMVLKHLQGAPWSEVLERERPLGEEGLDGHLRVLAQVAQAIAFAHDRGVVHRDLKPQNVMVGRFGEVTLLDWGLAAAMAHGDPRLPSLGDRQVLAGTPSYMAPEQLAEDDRRCGPGTDVYLLGALLYDLLHGHPPHRGASVSAILHAARVNRPALLPELDDDARQMLVACFDDAPGARPSAEAFAAWVERYRGLRGARLLVDRADMERERMVEALDASMPSTAAQHLSAARFGYHAASHAGLAVGPLRLEKLAGPMVGFYLGIGDPRSAMRLLDELEVSGPLRAEVEAQLSVRAAREGELVALEENLDLRVGLLTRSFVAALVGVPWILGPLVVYLWELWRTPISYPYLLLGSFASSAASLGLALWGWESLTRTLPNRFASVGIVFASAILFMAEARGMWMQLPSHEAIAVAQMGWLTLSVMGVLVVGREFLLLAAMHLGALAVTTWHPELVWLCISLCDVVFALVVLVPHREGIWAWFTRARNQERTPSTPG